MKKPTFPGKLVLYTGWRYLLKHAIQTLLMVMGISLGVAVAVAIDLANESSRRALDLSVDAVAGKATHQITRLPSGLAETYYRDLRLRFPSVPAAPQVSGVAQVREMDDGPVNLLGIDPLAETPFRNYLDFSVNPGSASGLSRFLTQPGAVAAGKAMVERYHLSLGQQLTLVYEGREHAVQLVAILDPPDELSRQSLDGVLLTDIASAQEILGKTGLLDEIDLIVPDKPAAIVGQIRESLPQGAILSETAARSSGLNQMTAAFQLNLSALSLLAMLVGMFLIYNTMTFSVLQRRRLFGTLRSLGVTRREIFTSVLIEAFTVGVMGALIGVGVGILLGRSTIGMVSQTVNDLYYTTTVRDVPLPQESLWKGFLLGVIASLVSALPPAWEASSVPASDAVTRISLENRARAYLQRATVSGVATLLLGWGVLTLPSNSLLTGFGGLILVVLGFALITGFEMVILLRLVNPLTSMLFGLVGKLAPRNLINTLSRTAVAIAAMMVALAVSIGMSLMISSFRSTVNTWLDTTLPGDIYITAPNFKSNQPTAAIDPAVLPFLRTVSGITRLDMVKVGYAQTPEGESIQISATNNDHIGKEKLYKYLWVPENEIWDRMQAGGVLITEPLAFRLGITKPGQVLRLLTDTGVRDFDVLGVYYDYASTEGTVQMDLARYRQWWSDDSVSTISMHLVPGTDLTSFARQLSATIPSRQQLVIRPVQVLREDVMVVFDRTFAITRALQILTTIVAFVGIINSLSLLQFEKQREMGILRVIGFTSRQLWSLGMLETGLMGLASGLTAMPAGYSLAVILIEVINRRSFGWSLQLAFSWEPLFAALGVALAAALLAGLAPAYKLSHIQTVEAIRYE